MNSTDCGYAIQQILLRSWGIIRMGKKLFAMLTMAFMLCGCATEMNALQEEKVGEQCTKPVELRVAALSEVWSTAQYYYGYWNQMPEDFD